MDQSVVINGVEGLGNIDGSQNGSGGRFLFIEALGNGGGKV